MAHSAPGKHHREGISLLELADMFPNEQAAHDWFAEQRWGVDGRTCPKCGGVRTTEGKDNRYWCGDCRNKLTVRTGTALEESRLPLRKWVFAIYIYATSLKGVSGMKLHRDLKVTQKTAWFMLHRLRAACFPLTKPLFSGPVEVDETYIGGKRKNMPKSRREKMTGRGYQDCH
ncbi:MAG: IS1595 family transposase [Rhodobacteraceae bacterium]|nr:IS1595 family transposase [Paracoccaceae bacterium]